MKILFIQTGGTIDKDYPRTSKGYAFEITEPAVNRVLAKISLSFDYEVISLLQKDSLDLTKDDRENIYNTCLQHESKKIIITHGTDTLKETAEALENIHEKTIILTGAMKPQKFSDTDADFNLGVAVGAIQTLPTGIYVALNGCIFDYKNMIRNESNGKYEKNI